MKAGQAEETIAGKGIISVQVLNEFASVAIQKLGMQLSEIQEILHMCVPCAQLNLLPSKFTIVACGLRNATAFQFMMR